MPDNEKFTLDFVNKVIKVLLPMIENFKSAVMAVLERELQGDVPTDQLAALRAAYEKMVSEFSALHPIRDIQDIHAFLETLTATMKAMQSLANVPGDLERMAQGLETVFKQFLTTPTAFLKSTMFDMLRGERGHEYLRPQSIDDYEALFGSLKRPLMLTVPRADWMTSADKPCEQDWYFGWMQIAGYNTTNLQGLVASVQADSDTVALGDLQKKMPISDAILQAVTGDASLTLASAIAANRLYVVDYVQFADAYSDAVHGEQRYITAPVAVFYWNPIAPPGYPPSAEGVLQPIAIQLGQQHNPETAPIYTPNNTAGGNDTSLMKWRIAKFFVNALCAMQHESIAHLGDCHLIIEPIIVAANRQLSDAHPLLKLLLPHFRFTININDDAIHSLITPGGVVATNVGPAIECSLAAVSAAHAAYRWDDRNPTRLFQRRGVDKIPVFPFRDDTLLLYAAIKPFVSSYLKVYYRNDQDVRDDTELQRASVNELVLPHYCGFKGMRGLIDTGNPKQPVRIESLDYLIDMVAQIIYTAGPQHASVNYAQYAMMSYMPAVAGTIYQPAPPRSMVLNSIQDCLPWYPALDVALYTFSFEYLLTEVQYDTFGTYEFDPRTPWFTDPRVQPLNTAFKSALAMAEIEIRKRNESRPMEYPFQIPSLMPNSISI
ncbi:MAG: arachidonate 15-lipoxygenase [Ahniella sp.]|nr:arachidonate 15-lipoxygenase [Ahniella sp.]